MLRIITVFFIGALISYGQNSRGDLLDKISVENYTTQIKILNKKVWNLRSSNPDSALAYGEIALRIGKEIDNKGLLAATHNFLGVVYRNIGNYDTSLRHYVAALNLAEEVRDSVQIAYSYNNIGGIHRLQGNYTLALEYILIALKHFESIGNLEGTAYCTINVGILYRYQKNFVKALEYFERTLQIREEIGDQFGKTLALNQFAEVYYEQKNWDEALKYYRRLEKAYWELNEIKGIAAVWGGMGGVFYYKGEYGKALDYRLRALKLDEDIDNLEGQIINLTNIGLIYAKKSQFSLAEQKLNIALSLADQMESLNMRLECYDFIKEFYIEKRDYKQALLYSQKYNLLKDSILTNSNIARVAEMEAVYRTEKTEREKRILLQDIELKEKQQLYLIIIVVLGLIFVIFIYNRYRASKITSTKLRELNGMKDKFVAILAHDLKNPLNTILGYSEYLLNSYDNFTDVERKEEISAIYTSSKRISSLIDMILEWVKSQTGAAPVNPVNLDINKVIENNIALFEQNARMKRISISAQSKGPLPAFCDENILSSILRNLISNALKFTHADGTIIITSDREKDTIKISVKDNGVGIPAEILEKLFRIDREFSTTGTNKEKGTGLGLILTKDLLEKLGGNLSVVSELGKGSTFTFTIPCK